jgi:hypothetical protein
MPEAVEAMTIAQWCEAQKVSLPYYFKLQRKGLGPKTIRIGTRFVRITVEAHREWVARMAKLAEGKKAQQERARKLKWTQRGGNRSVELVGPPRNRRQRSAKQQERRP